MIYTSYFAKIKLLPSNIIPISICGKKPDWYKGLEYKPLAPKYNFFQEWKRNHDNDYYTDHYKKEVLKGLNVMTVMQRLYSMANFMEVALICYESPDKFCHRHLVAKWINEWAGYERVKEWQEQLPLFESLKRFR